MTGRRSSLLDVTKARILPSLQQVYAQLTTVRFSKPALDILHKELKEMDLKEESKLTKQFKKMNLNKKVTKLLGLDQTDSFFETAMKIEEDIAVMHKGKLVAICFCFPSGWIPSNELNSDLSKLHAPVADNELLIKSSEKLAKHMNKQTIRRWVWNVTTISNLSNHPNIDRPKIIDFDSLYFRLETQVSTPLDDESSLFLVKVDVFPLKKVWNEKILESINSMSESVLKYKNLIEIKNFLNS